MSSLTISPTARVFSLRSFSRSYLFSFLSFSLELLGSIISTLQRSCSRSLSTYPLRPRCFVSSWLPGNTREHEFLIKFHSFLVSLFFRFSQPHLNCAGIEMAVALIRHSAPPILRSRFPLLSFSPRSCSLS